MSGGEVPGGTTARSPAGRGGEVADAPRTYYGTAVLKEPVWSSEIAVYFFTGGLAGASAPLAFAAELAGNARLARSAWLAAFAGIAVSPVLLIVDLGRPERFLNMLRVFKITSPMSVGTWVLSAAGAAITPAAARSVTGHPRRLGAAGGAVAAALGPALATYTAVLLSDTAVPAWHEARRHLPFTFAAGAAGSAGAAAVLLTPAADAAPARRLAIIGAAGELICTQLLTRRLGMVGRPYREGKSGKFLKLAEALTGAGALVIAGKGRSRPAAAAGAALVLAGAMATRWSVFRAGFASSADPGYVVGPQRERLTAASDALEG
jgi:formate-dependent nitrite reductase membrane component NrfD